MEGLCSQCDPDYVMTDTRKCVNKDDFCWSYDSNGICSECAPTHHMSKLKGKCLQNEPGCIYDHQDMCSSCDKPFHFDGVRCDVYGCLKLANNGCDTCNYPMQVVNSTGLCWVVNCEQMVNASCELCKSGFVLATDGSCKPQDSKCLVVSVTGCSVCMKGYVVDGNGVCQYTDEHCASFSTEGSCTNCDRLYFLNGYSKCEIRDSNCVAYSGGNCVQCKDYSFVYQGRCFPNAKGCLTQVNTKTCSVCETGYNLDSGICIPSITKLDWNSVNMDFFAGDSKNA